MLYALIATLLITFYPQVPVEVSDLIGRAVVKASKDHDIPPELILAVMQKESTFNPYSVAGKCRGLMQINLSVWQIPISEAHSIYGGTWHGTRILKFYLDKNHGNLQNALYGYRGAKDDDYVQKVIKYRNWWKAKLGDSANQK